MFCRSRNSSALGSGRTHRVDVRLVAATHQDLERKVKRGALREGPVLLCLNVFPVTLPPLRDRREDIAPLIEHYVEVFCCRIGKSIDNIPEEFVDACKGPILGRGILESFKTSSSARLSFQMTARFLIFFVQLAHRCLSHFPRAQR